MPDQKPPALFTPPDEAIQCGYWLTKARIAQELAEASLIKALGFAHAATPILVSQAGAFKMQVSPGMKLIGEAIAGCHTAGTAHDTLRKLMLDLGYRPITNQDFAEYGDGGGR